MLSKSELVAATLQDVVDSLAAMQQGHDSISIPEVENLAERVGSLRIIVIEQLGDAARELRPEQQKTRPDYFGQTIFTLLHHTERAISDGYTETIGRVFPSVLSASLKLHEHVDVTYRPPTYEITPANFNPILGVLELSGLALVYEQLRGDGSAEPIRQAWADQGDPHNDVEGFATEILDILDQAHSRLVPQSIMRREWETRVAQSIVDKGFAIPDYNPFEDEPEWAAPPLIRMVGVTKSYLNVSLHPYLIFAGQVVGPLSGENDEHLRSRPSLRRYYEALDRYAESDDPATSGSDGNTNL